MADKNTDRVLDLIIDKLEKLHENQVKLAEEIQKTNLELSKISGFKHVIGDLKTHKEELEKVVNIEDFREIKKFYSKNQDLDSDIEDLYVITGELRQSTDDYKKFKTKVMTAIVVITVIFSIATTIIGWIIK